MNKFEYIMRQMADRYIRRISWSFSWFVAAAWRTYDDKSYDSSLWTSFIHYIKVGEHHFIDTQIHRKLIQVKRTRPLSHDDRANLDIFPQTSMVLVGKVCVALLLLHCYKYWFSLRTLSSFLCLTPYGVLPATGHKQRRAWNACMIAYVYEVCQI